MLMQCMAVATDSQLKSHTFNAQLFQFHVTTLNKFFTHTYTDASVVKQYNLILA